MKDNKLAFLVCITTIQIGLNSHLDLPTITYILCTALLISIKIAIAIYQQGKPRWRSILLFTIVIVMQLLAYIRSNNFIVFYYEYCIIKRISKYSLFQQRTLYIIIFTYITEIMLSIKKELRFIFIVLTYAHTLLFKPQIPPRKIIPLLETVETPNKKTQARTISSDSLKFSTNSFNKKKSFESPIIHRGNIMAKYPRSNSIDYQRVIEESQIISMLDISIILVNRSNGIKYSNLTGLKLIDAFNGIRTLLQALRKPNSDITLSTEINRCFAKGALYQTCKLKCTRIQTSKKIVTCLAESQAYSISIRYIEPYDCVLLLISVKPPQSKLSSSLVNDCLMEITSCSLFHELLNLTNGISGHLELLENVVPVNQGKYLKSAQLYSRLLSYRLRDIDDFTKITFNKFKLHISCIEIFKFFKELKQIIGLQAKTKQIELLIQNNKDIPKTVVTDRSRLLQVMINTISTLLETLSMGKIYVTASNATPATIDFIITVDTPESSKIKSTFEAIKTFQSLITQSTSPLRNMEGVALSSTSIIALKLGRGMEFIQNDKLFEVHVFINDDFNVPKNDKRKRKSSLRNSPYLNDDLSLCKTLKPNNKRELPNNVAMITNADECSRKKSCDDHPPSIIIEDDMELLDVAEELITKVEVVRQLKPFSLKSIVASCQSSKDVRIKKRIRCNTLLTDNNCMIPNPMIKAIDDNDDFNCIIADDNDTNLFVLKELLKSFCINAIQTKNGLECLKMVIEYIESKKIFHIKVMFMDMQMPVMDGVEATKAIIKHMDSNGVKRIPIIGVSSSNNEEDRSKFLMAGISEFIPKPVTKDILSALIIKYTGN